MSYRVRQRNRYTYEVKHVEMIGILMHEKNKPCLLARHRNRFDGLVERCMRPLESQRRNECARHPAQHLADCACGILDAGAAFDRH